MIVVPLTTVDGEIVFDLPEEVAATAAGGTRVAEGVTVEETALLARAMTAKFATFGARLGGAKAGIRPRLIDTHAETMARYCEEIRPLVESGRFLTDADLGTRHADFATLRAGSRADRFEELVDGVPFEEVVTGRGVVAAAAAWFGGLDGRTVAVEGFGSVGAGVARAVDRAGGRVVAVSTIDGAVADGRGLAVERLLDARGRHGDRFVHELGLEVHRPAELYELEVDVLVPGARTGALDATVADRVQARVVVPAANVPYTEAGLARLRTAKIPALADFVCNGGAVLGHRLSAGLPVHEVLDLVEREIAGRVEASRLARIDPYVHAWTMAETFLGTWVPVECLPSGPPLAPEPPRR